MFASLESSMDPVTSTSSNPAMPPWHPAGASLPGLHRLMALVVLLGCAGGSIAEEPPRQALAPITVTASSSSAVEKSYRRMVRGMDHFDTARTLLAPAASLRFKLLPRKPGTDMDRIELAVVGTTFDYAVPVAADHTFVLDRDPKALRENAVVSPNRRRTSMTWRTEIRTPGWPADTRRLGDLRLECQVGLEADLVSNRSTIGRIVELFTDTLRYCDRKDAQYLFFAERPLFNVTLVDGARREALPIDRLYAMASDDPALKDDLPFCDCEMLVDRTYFLPLGDKSWSNETRVEFEYMDDRR